MTITRTITVAAGVFAPGHLGELTRMVPFELADAVLEETGARERRLRVLPSRVGVYFVLAMGLFPRAGYLGVWAKLTAALDGLGLAVPSAKALRDLRRRIGAAPLKALFEVLAGPLGQPRTPGVMFGRYRTVAFDGCRSLKVPDTPRNRAWLGKMNAALGETGYPVIQLMTLCETGTRALIGAVFGTPADRRDRPGRASCCTCWMPDMLVLMDRGFDAGEFLAEVAATKAQFLVRLTATRRPPVLAPPARRVGAVASSAGSRSGSSTAEVTVTCHDGTRYGGSYRLATTLLDHRAYPAGRADRLVPRALGARDRLPRAAAHPAARAGCCAPATRPAWSRRCGRCWPCTRRCGSPSPTPSPPSRAPTPTGPATRSPSRPPRRWSPAPAESSPAASDLAGDIGRAVLASLHGPRRPRVCARRVKSPLSRWNKHPPGKPRTCQRITKITTTIRGGHPPAATRHQQCVTTASGP